MKKGVDNLSYITSRKEIDISENYTPPSRQGQKIRIQLSPQNRQACPAKTVLLLDPHWQLRSTPLKNFVVALVWALLRIQSNLRSLAK